MRIVFDRRWAGEHGIGRFASEFRSRSQLEIEDLRSNTKPASATGIIASTLELSHLRKEDIFLSPGYVAPIHTSAQIALTIHDLNHIDTTGNSNNLKRFYYRNILLPSIKRAQLILTVSEFTKQRIIDWSGISSAKISIVGNGVSSAFTSSGPKHLSRKPYILCVSNRKAHKNEERLIQAFSKFNANRHFDLVFTGSASPQLDSLIQHCGQQAEVKFTGRLSDESLAEYYRAAACLAFPSVYEGFGLPIIEAMACKCPVLCGNESAPPEIAGNAACIVNTRSVQAISDALFKVSTDSEWRTSLIQKGTARAALFSWEKVAQRIDKALIDNFK